MNIPIRTALAVINIRGVVAGAAPDSPQVASTWPADVGIGQLLNWVEQDRRLQVTALHTPPKSKDCDAAVEGLQPSVSQHLQTQRVPIVVSINNPTKMQMTRKDFMLTAAGNDDVNEDRRSKRIVRKWKGIK